MDAPCRRRAVWALAAAQVRVATVEPAAKAEAEAPQPAEAVEKPKRGRPPKERP